MRDDYSPQIRTYVDILLNMRKEKDDTVNTAADVLLKTGKTMQDDYLQGLALYARCFVYYRSGHAMQAYDLLRSALSHLLKTQAWPQIIGILNMIGLVSMRMGNTASAMEAYLQGLAFAEEHNLSEQITLMNINLADVCLRADAYGNAYAYVQKAESLLDQLRLNERYEEYATIAIAECALLASFTKQEEDAGRYISLVQELIKEYPSAASNPTMMILELYRTKKPADSYDCAKKLLPVMKRNDILDEGGTEFLFYLRYLSQHNYKDLFYQISDYFIHALGPDSLPGDVIPPLQVIVAFDEDFGNHKRFLDDLQLLWKYTRLSNASSRESTIQYIQTRSLLMDTIRKNNVLTQLADTDPLSGLPNRRSFNRKADEWFEIATYQDIPLAVEMIDIDHFKQINDTKGHEAGDKAIQTIAKCLKKIEEDKKVYVSRYGGDEFIVLYLGMSVEQVKAKAIALRDYVNQASKEAGIPMTIAQGIAHHNVRYGNKIWDYTSRADIAMYYAKKSHPNAIMIIDKRSDLDHPLYAD